MGKRTLKRLGSSVDAMRTMENRICLELRKRRSDQLRQPVRMVRIKGDRMRFGIERVDSIIENRPLEFSSSQLPASKQCSTNEFAGTSLYLLSRIDLWLFKTLIINTRNSLEAGAPL